MDNSQAVSMLVDKTTSQKSLQSAEMAAGIKAFIQPEPAKKALTSLKGRVMAHIICRLPGNKNILNYGNAREVVITTLAQRYLETLNYTACYIEMAAGFSTRGLEITQKASTVSVVEVDFPAVIARKIARIKTLTNNTIPDNITWCAADLSVTRLRDVLPEKEYNLIVAEGLLIYLTPSEIARIIISVHDMLSAGGMFICEVFGQTGLSIAEQESGFVTRLVQKKAGIFHGRFASHEEIRHLFEDAGFCNLEIAELLHLNSTIGKNYAIPDGGIIIQARKPS